MSMSRTLAAASALVLAAGVASRDSVFLRFKSA